MALENLHLDMTKEKIRTALELRFGEVKDVNVILSDDHVTALVTMSAREAADDALGFMQHAIPEGLRKAPHSRLVAYSVPESGGQQMSHLNATIEISCHYPSQIAWANFRDWRQAQKAAQKLNGRIFGGRQLQAKLNHTTVPPGGSVSITNIPLKTRAEDLRRFIDGGCDLKIEPPKYTILDMKRNLPTLFRRYGNLVSFEISPMKDNATKVFAFARFSDLAESSTAVEELRNKKVEALNNSPIYLEIISSIKYSVRYKLWLVLEPEVKQALNTCNEGRTDIRNSVKFALFERKNTHDYIQKLRIYSKDTKSLGRAKMAIDKIVKGDIIKSGDDVLWDRDFESPAGQEKLASFAIPGRCELVWDCALRRITLYGEEAARQTAKSSVMEYFRTIKSRRQVFPISSRGRLASLLSGGLRSLRSRFGENNVRLDLFEKTLEIRGPEDEGLDLDRLLLTPASGPRIQLAAEERAGDCPVCYCELENPILFGCGHSYCKVCFDLCISSALVNRSFPICCVTCNTKLDLTVLSRLSKFDNLLSASVLSFVSKHPTSYAYCPTPDCPQIYPLGPAGSISQCSECLAYICTFCKTEWHEGISCVEIKELENPELRKNAALMKQMGIKSCPQCKSLIEKTAGCNHMTCGGCKTHLCWVCMKDFGQSGGQIIYTHMRQEHGGIGI